MVEQQPSKLRIRVRFPVPAPIDAQMMEMPYMPVSNAGFCELESRPGYHLRGYGGLVYAAGLNPACAQCTVPVRVGLSPPDRTFFANVAQAAERLPRKREDCGFEYPRWLQPFDFSSCRGGGIWHTRMSQTHVPEGSSPSPGTSSIRRWWNWSTRQLERLVGCKALAGSNPALRTIAADFA